jgi:hypothetical protein
MVPLKYVSYQLLGLKNQQLVNRQIIPLKRALYQLSDFEDPSLVSQFNDRDKSFLSNGPHINGQISKSHKSVNLILLAFKVP